MMIQNHHRGLSHCEDKWYDMTTFYPDTQRWKKIQTQNNGGFVFADANEKFDY